MPESERILIRAFNLTNIKEVIIMTVITQITIAVALVLSIILPFGYYLLGEKSRGRYKTALGVNAFFFFGIMLVAIAVTFAGGASVQAATGADAGLATGMGYIAAALVKIGRASCRERV